MRSLALFPIIGALAVSAASADAPLVLFTPETVAAGRVHTTDATVALEGSGNARALRVVTGHAQPWPGVTIAAPKGLWNLTPYAAVALRLRNLDSAPLTLTCRVDNPGADGTNHCVNGSVQIPPGAASTLRVLLKRTHGDTMGGRLFGMVGYPAAPGGPETVDPANVTQFLVFLDHPTAEHTWEIEDARAIGAYIRPTASTADADPYFPFIDAYGQYRHRDWPGKLHSDAELESRRDAEERELAGEPGPADWDRFGGWKGGPRVQATGFFRTEKRDGRWWLVDPDGRLFFSNGIDSVGLADATPVQERASWFADFPGERTEFSEFVVPHAMALLGHYAGRLPRAFNFAEANLRRKYGPGWRRASAEAAQRRLRSWGLNTLGMWSDDGVRMLRRTPYVDALSSGGARPIAGSKGYWGQFPDPFDPSFRKALRNSMAAARGKSAGDPWCLGYFSDNELSWGENTALAEGTLRSPADQPAKQAFAADLKARYGEVGKLNAAWGTAYPSWDALLAATTPPDRSRARADLLALTSHLAEEYFRTVREAVREVAPHQLYLGCRFAWTNPRAEAAAAKYCDVVSYNVYRRTAADLHLDADVPLLIGEFHFGALDRGMFHTGLVPVESQADRAAAYSAYVRSALRNPQVVGCHWFEYRDEPTTGRAWDGENYQIGFVDVADAPYRETVDACRAVSREMYRLRSGTGERR